MATRVVALARSPSPRKLATAVTMGGGGSKMPPEPVERTKPGVAPGGKPPLCFGRDAADKTTQAARPRKRST